MKLGFICRECRAKQTKWMGRCPGCGAWNSLEEQKQEAEEMSSYRAPQTLSSISHSSHYITPSGISELDRILGGGIHQSSSILMSGDPGIGKSTLMLQLAAAIGLDTLYVSGEETAQQISLRSRRLNITTENIQLLCENSLENIITAMHNIKPVLVIIDSIQTIQSLSVAGSIGSVSQIRHAVHELIAHAHTLQACVIVLAHVTKDRDIAGPKLLEHVVDTVLFLEQGSAGIRILRIIKNRHGNCDELGLFAMQEHGLHPVKDPSSVFLNRRNTQPPSGITITPVYEGSRVFLVEIQALSTSGNVIGSRVYSDRVDARRVSRIAAVLEKHTKIRLSDKDVYINIAGGIRITDVAMDAALALALYSTYTGLVVPADTVVAGEISLAGEVRPVPWIPQRIRTCRDMQFRRIIIPARTKTNTEEGTEEKLEKYSGINVIPVSDLREILTVVLPEEQNP